MSVDIDHGTARDFDGDGHANEYVILGLVNPTLDARSESGSIEFQTACTQPVASSVIAGETDVRFGESVIAGDYLLPSTYAVCITICGSVPRSKVAIIRPQRSIVARISPCCGSASCIGFDQVSPSSVERT